MFQTLVHVPPYVYLFELGYLGNGIVGFRKFSVRCAKLLGQFVLPVVCFLDFFPGIGYLYHLPAHVEKHCDEQQRHHCDYGYV